MINFLNAKIQKTELNDFLKIAAITCFISDIANVCYIIYSYLPLSLNRVLLQSTLMNQGIMVSKLGPNELEEFKSLLINTFSGAFFIILIQNGMNLMRVGSYLQMVVIGALLIVAIGAEYFRQQMLSKAKK